MGYVGKYRQLRLYEVGAVAHDGLEALVAGGALPLGHQVEHVLALPRFAVLDALLARQPHLQLREHGQVRDGVHGLRRQGGGR